MIKEITAQELNTEQFIHEKVKEIKDTVGDGLAINALSGGVDSSTVTMLGHRALGQHLKTFFIENGLMREGEPKQVADYFRKLGAAVEIVDARRSSSRHLRVSRIRKRSVRLLRKPSTETYSDALSGKVEQGIFSRALS